MAQVGKGKIIWEMLDMLNSDKIGKCYLYNIFLKLVAEELENS